MTAKKIAALMLSVIISAFAFASCHSSSGENNTKTTTSPNGGIVTAAPESPTTQASAESATEEETTADDFSFSAEDAEYLGKMDSDIYGKLFVYFQDAHIAILNEYDAVLFSFDAQNYAPAEETVTEDGEKAETVLAEDINFDNYNDLMILYRQTALNSFYLCWTWDMASKSYVYYEPLADLPNLTFDSLSGSVYSLNRSSSKSAILTTYTWQDGDLYPVSHKTVASDGDIVIGPDDVDTGIAITDGLALSVVSLYGNKNSNSRWICKIEDERYVKLYEDSYNEADETYRFVFRGMAQGTTTVVLRFATGWNAEYIAEKVLNITVKPDATLIITEIK